MDEEHRWFCGGTILNEYIILTAAHCMNETRYFYIKLGKDAFAGSPVRLCVCGAFINLTIAYVFPGEFDMLVDEGTEAIHEVETIMTHYKYKADTYHNDIALIKLATPIKYSRFIVPACIPEAEFAESVKPQTHHTPSWLMNNEFNPSFRAAVVF